MLSSYGTLRPWIWLFGCAAVVIIIAGLKAIGHIITPFLLAAFMAIISMPALTWLQRKGVPGPIAIIILFLVVGLSFSALFLALKNTVESLVGQAPIYQMRLLSWLDDFRQFAIQRGVNEDMIPQSLPLPDTATLTGFAKIVAANVGHLSAYTFFVLLAFMFFLLEESTLNKKLEAAFPYNRRAKVRTRRFLRSVNRYLVIKTTSSLVTGFIIGAGLYLIGVDFAILWGVLAGLLNFIPTVGSFIALVPGVLIALLGLGVKEAMFALSLYIVTNVLIGSILEPRLMGQTLGLSPIVVLVSLLLWGWVFGPVGMLLAILLTMIVKLALESSPQTRWLGILLSDRIRSPKGKVD